MHKRESEEKIIHVDKLTIHAKEVNIIREERKERRRDYPRRNPWGFFWGRPAEQERDRLEDESSSIDSK